MSDNDNDIDSSSNENWCLIESDPGVFTELIELFGCGTIMEVMELYSIEDDNMIQQSLQLLPSIDIDTIRLMSNDTNDTTTNTNKEILDLLQLNCYGLIFLFEYNNTIQQLHGQSNEDDDIMEDSNTTSTTENSISNNNIFFARQITNNACATQAILSIIMNTVHNTETSISFEQLGTMLSEFYTFTYDLPPYYKGMAITSSIPIRTAHNSFTNSNDTFISLNQLDQQKKKKKKRDEHGEAFHFVAYVPINGVVYELDGLQKKPIVVGPIHTTTTTNNNNDTTTSTNTNSNKYQWLSVARKAIQDRMEIIGSNTGTDVKFNLMAVTSNRLQSLQTLKQLYDVHNNENQNINNNDNMNQVVEETTATTSSSVSTSPNDILLLNNIPYYTILNEIQIQEQKRIQYKYENQRRRHNYLNLILNVFKELQRKQVLQQYIQMAKDKHNK